MSTVVYEGYILGAALAARLAQQALKYEPNHVEAIDLLNRARAAQRR